MVINADGGLNAKEIAHVEANDEHIQAVIGSIDPSTHGVLCLEKTVAPFEVAWLRRKWQRSTNPSTRSMARELGRRLEPGKVRLVVQLGNGAALGTIECRPS